VRGSEIRRERNREYFIKAARQVIEERGIKALNIRRVSELAGYSPASVYNYFGSMDGLIGAVKDSYAVDAMEYISARLTDSMTPLERLETSYRYFAEYFLDRPEIFKLIFMSGFGKGTDREAAPNFTEMAHHSVMKDLNVGEATLARVENILSSMLFGNLYFLSFGLTDIDRDTLLENVSGNVSFVMDILGGSE
jgi:AcrR family transcriptional regulator